METSEPRESRSPLRELTVRLDSGGGNRLEMQFVENGGTVNLKLRTQDQQVAASLRGDISTLESDLIGRGWKAELTASGDPPARPAVAPSTERADAQSQTRATQSTLPAGGLNLGSGRDSEAHDRQRSWAREEQELLELAALRRLAVKGGAK